jgi:hypothetical protein
MNNAHVICPTNITRNPIAETVSAIEAALRVLDLVPAASTDYVPHPLVTIRAELNQALRSLRRV